MLLTQTCKCLQKKQELRAEVIFINNTGNTHICYIYIIRVSLLPSLLIGA